MAAAAAAYGALSFHEAADAIMVLCSRGNLLLEEVQPWTALKKVHMKLWQKALAVPGQQRWTERAHPNQLGR